MRVDGLSDVIAGVFTQENSRPIAISYRGKSGFVTVLSNRFEFVRFKLGFDEVYRGSLVLPCPEIEREVLVDIWEDQIVVALPWDTAFYFFHLRPGVLKPKIVNRVHTQPISAIAVNERLVATGSLDSSFRIWARDKTALSPMSLVARHRAGIAHAAISQSFRTCLSIGNDGYLIATSTIDGRFLCAMDLNGKPSLMTVSERGWVIVAFNQQNSSLVKVLDHNIKEVTEKTIPAPISCWKAAFWGDGAEFLITATRDRRLLLFKLPYLEDMGLQAETRFELEALELVSEPTSLLIVDVRGNLQSLNPVGL
jgi:WD40 repeat protein